MCQLPASVTMMQQGWGIGLRVIGVANAPLLCCVLKHFVQRAVQFEKGLPTDVHMAERIGLSLIRNGRCARVWLHVGVPEHFFVFMPHTGQRIDKA